jgi:hypothetical protein
LRTRLWWLTAACAVVAIVLASTAVRQRTTAVTVRFQDGHGIKPDDAVRYLGIEIGRVASVELTPDLNGLQLGLQLEQDAATVARAGSQFWIERPQVSLSRIRGLDTVVGARYVQVIPGPATAQPCTSFQGLEVPPALPESLPAEISIEFREGHGLSTGDYLKHRGIVVGEVRDVRLQPDLRGVQVTVQLVAGAERLAREGSQFWIERPEVSMSRIRGLDTVVTGRHLAVMPGPESAGPQSVFVGREQAPAVTQWQEGSLEILLEADARHGLTAGAPLTYRGVTVGQITSLGLASDARTVESRVGVWPEFRGLVRESTHFWAISGVDVSLGLTGLRMDVESFSTLAGGGVAMSTPEPPGREVATGHRFVLHARPREDWRTWQPSLPIGTPQLTAGGPLPTPVRASLNWQPRRLGIRRGRQKDAWLLLLSTNRLLGPADVLAPAGEVLDSNPTLSLAGTSGDLSRADVRKFGQLALYGPVPAQVATLPFPVTRLQAPVQPESCVLVADPLGRTIPISTGRLQPAKSGWRVDPAIPLDENWHGAAVVSRASGNVIGLLCIQGQSGVIRPVTRQLATAASHRDADSPRVGLRTE